jgi:hypothetical protein
MAIVCDAYCSFEDLENFDKIVFFLHGLVAVEELKLFSSQPDAADQAPRRHQRVLLLRQVKALLLLPGVDLMNQFRPAFTDKT